MSITDFGAVNTSNFWFLSYPYGSTYRFPSFKAIIDYLAQGKNPPGELYGARIIEGYVGTSYGRPFIRKTHTTRQELKEYMQDYDYTKEQIKTVLGML